MLWKVWEITAYSAKYRQSALFGGAPTKKIIKSNSADTRVLSFIFCVHEAGPEIPPSLAYVHLHTHENARGKPLRHPDRAFTQHAAWFVSSVVAGVGGGMRK